MSSKALGHKSKINYQIFLPSSLAKAKVELINMHDLRQTKLLRSREEINALQRAHALAYFPA